MESLEAVAAIKKQRPYGFQKGVSGNPAGRRKGSKSIAGLLDAAIKAAQAKRATLKEPCACVASELVVLNASEEFREKLYAKSCQTLDAHFARRAWLNDTILVAFQKKRIPDLSHQTGAPPTAITIAYGHERRVTVAQPLLVAPNGV